MDQAIINLVSMWDGYGMAVFTAVTSLIAGVLSSLIGLEREMKGQAAGLRTHVIVTVACSLLMTLSIYAIRLAVKDQEGFSNLSYDAARIAAGILGGIGFMGAGTIVKNGLSIRGLTTAATVWLCAAIGMACGCGFVLEAIVVTLISLGLLFGLTGVEKFIDKKSPQVILSVSPSFPIVTELRTEAEKDRLIIKNIVSEHAKGSDGNEVVNVTVFFAYRSDPLDIAGFVERFSSYPYVFKAEQVSKKKKVEVENN